MDQIPVRLSHTFIPLNRGKSRRVPHSLRVLQGVRFRLNLVDAKPTATARDRDLELLGQAGAGIR